MMASWERRGSEKSAWLGSWPSEADSTTLAPSRRRGTPQRLKFGHAPATTQYYGPCGSKCTSRLVTTGVCLVGGRQISDSIPTGVLSIPKTVSLATVP
jgi:hypothetical protein